MGAAALVLAALAAGWAVIAAAGESTSDSAGWAAERERLLARVERCLGERDPACLLRQAKAAALWVEDRQAIEWLSSLRADIHAGLGHLDLARETAWSIEDGDLRVETLATIAGQAAAYGDRQGAADLLSEAEAELRDGAQDFGRIDARASIGWAHAKLGDMKRAEARWREAEDLWNELGAPPEQARALYALAWCKINAGAVADARPAIEWLDQQVAWSWPESEGPPYRFSMSITFDSEGRSHAIQLPIGEPIARAFAAVLFAQAGMTDEAMEAVKSIEELAAYWDELGSDDDFPIEVVRAQAALRRFVDASNTARAIYTGYGRALAFCVIAHEQGLLAEENTASLQQSLEYLRELGPSETARIAICMAGAIQ
ncbi:MAG: hypothetical protein AB7P52_11545 [Alphaproteobacteria bacterium]